MYTKSTLVVNPTGLHARPASDFVKAAKAFRSKITLRKENDAEDNEANAKSIISVLALCAVRGTRLEISADGEDEQEAVEKLVALVDAGFGE